MFGKNLVNLCGNVTVHTGGSSPVSFGWFPSSLETGRLVDCLEAADEDVGSDTNEGDMGDDVGAGPEVPGKKLDADDTGSDVETGADEDAS